MGSAADGHRLPDREVAHSKPFLKCEPRCISARVARRSVDWSILIVIGAGLGIATAMQKTGAAAYLAGMIAVGAGSLGPWVTLILVYVMAMLLAELLHHNAAVAIMFPIAVAAAAQVGDRRRPGPIPSLATREMSMNRVVSAPTSMFSRYFRMAPADQINNHLLCR